MKVCVAPSLLSADFANISEEISRCINAEAEYLHYDVMDGHFVPNITFGAPVVKCLTKISKPLINDVHLMINNPSFYIKDFVDAGADIITFHYEAIKSDKDIFTLIDQIHKFGVKAGISVKPYTPVERIYPFLTSLDLVLIMTVEPGFGGQSFMYEPALKIEKLKKYLISNRLENVLIEVDGGINESTAKICRDFGVDILVAGSYLFSHEEDMATRVKKIKG